MKPNPKNLKYCVDCHKPKLSFETEEKAKRFIEFNSDEIDSGGNELRPYYCPTCCAWHVSKKRFSVRYSTKTNQMIDAYNEDKKKGKVMSHKWEFKPADTKRRSFKHKDFHSDEDKQEERKRHGKNK